MLSALVEEYEKQKELSKVLDITAPRLSEILNGRKEPTYRLAQKNSHYSPDRRKHSSSYLVTESQELLCDKLKVHLILISNDTVLARLAYSYIE